jgi:uncharacterized membrane protein YphA (DoxX/SURF4 family)
MIGSFTRFLPPLGVAVVLLILAIGLGNGLRPAGGAILGTVIGLIVIGAIALAAYLWAVCRRPLAAVGALLAGAAVLVAFYAPAAIAPWVWWTVLFFVGVGLIAYDTAKDTIRLSWWPMTLLRVFLGWAWVDNAQDHWRVGNWLAGDGGGFAQTATGAANRAPLWFVDSLYQGFLRGAILANVDGWAGLTAAGELAFGLLLALGFLTPVAAWLSLWQSANYMLMKGFLSHGAYTDKVFFIGDLAVMLTAAGLVYGVDAALQRHVPAWFAKWFLGVPEVEQPAPEPTPVGQVSPQPT